MEQCFQCNFCNCSMQIFPGSALQQAGRVVVGWWVVVGGPVIYLVQFFLLNINIVELLHY